MTRIDYWQFFWLPDTSFFACWQLFSKLFYHPFNSLLALSSTEYRSKWSQHSLSSWVILSSEFSPPIFVTTVLFSKSISPFEICFLHLHLTHYLRMLFQNCLLSFYFLSMSFVLAVLRHISWQKPLKWKSDKNMILWKTLSSYNVWNILKYVSKVVSELP